MARWRVAFDNAEHIVGEPMEPGVDYVDVDADGAHEAIEIAKDIRKNEYLVDDAAGVLSVFTIGRPLVAYIMAAEARS